MRKAENLSDIAQVRGGKRLPLGETFSDEGIPYIRAEDVKNGFIDFENSPKISPSLQDYLRQYQIEKEDVAITIVGNSIGDVGIVKFDIEKCNLTENCVKITGLKQISPNYLFSFLISSFSQNQIDREKVGTAQPKLAIERIRLFKIPILSINFQQEIDNLVNVAYTRLEESKALYTDAENLLLAKLGLFNWQPTNEQTAVKSLNESFLATGRLDAEYYQKKYDETEVKIKGLSCGWDIVGNHFEQNKNQSDSSKAGYNYIEIGDINISNGQASNNYTLTEELPANAKIMAGKGDLLISKVRPYRGAVSIIDFQADDLIVSGAFTVLREKGVIRKETLAILLKTAIYKDWLLKFNVGSTYPVIKDEDILNLPIPLVEINLQDEIADKIQKSSRKIKQSKRLLELAKRAVETAIEADEAAALEIIRTEGVI